jgi:hypothetical protein
MLRAGAENLFTGESGAVAYLLVLALFAVAGFCRAVTSGRAGGRREAAALGAGMLLLVSSRVAGVYSISAGAGPSAFPAAAGLAGLYLLIATAVSGRRRGEYSPVRTGVLAGGLVSGAALGAAAAALFPGSPGFTAVFTAAAPAGMAAGMFFGGDRDRPRGFHLGHVSVISLAASAAVSAFPLALEGSGSALFQLGALLDIAGMFLFLAWLVLEPAGSRPEASPGQLSPDRAQAGAGRTPKQGMRVVEISRAIVDGERENDIYREIAESIREETGAAFAVVRSAGDGEERLEVKGYCGDGGGPRSPSFSTSLTKARLGETIGDRQGDVHFLDGGALGDAREAFVPSALLSNEGSVAVMPVRMEGDLRAVVAAGFFRENPPWNIAEVLREYAVNVHQIVGRESWSGKTRTREKQLAVCREELESVNQLKSNFLSIVSHELRTPLTSIKAYAETLMDNVGSVDAGTVKDFLKVMGEENDRVITLVDNILNYSCMENGHLKVQKEECDLNSLIEDVHASLESRMLAGRVNSELKLPRKKVVVDADRELLRQMLSNLISNAIKFTPPGGRVTVILEEEASAARIVVQDTGRGIPEDQLEKIFERFHQVDASDTREHGGSGLGLAICKNIVEWHDGSIWVENLKEAGAKFTVILPMKDIVVRHAVSAGFIGSVRFERERFLTLLVEMLSGFLQARKSSIMLFDPRDRTLQVVAAKGLDPEFVQNTRIEAGERIAGKVFAEEEALHVFDIERDGKIARSNNTAYYWTKSFISVPLRDGDEVIGVLNVADHVENRGFTEADREILESLGPVISGMVKKLSAFETVSSNFEKLKEAMKSILHIREVWGARNMLNFTIIAMAVARRLNLDEKSLTAIRMGMSMYDLGMMKIPRSLRIKKGSLTDKEWEKLREHPDLGYALVSPMGLDERIMKMVRGHHEHYDGSGYPSGLMKDEIPVEARILGVVDAFRALITPGPYRRCFTVDEARNEIIQGAGTRFDPKVVGAFVKALHDLGARDEGSELVLGSVEKELEERAAGPGRGTDAEAGTEETDKAEETEETAETVKEGS